MGNEKILIKSEVKAVSPTIMQENNEHKEFHRRSVGMKFHWEC